MAALRLLFALLIVALAAPAAASAGSVSISGGVLTFTANPSEANVVSVNQPGGPGTSFEISDGGQPPATTQPTCGSVNNTVTCDGAGVTEVRAILGDLDDSAVTGELGVPILLDGGDGADVLMGGGGADDLDGGRGDDTLTGSGGADVIDGGRGDDDLDGGSGQDTLDAGPGSDVIRARDGETDGLTCGSESDAATVDFPDVVAADCEAVDRSPDPNPPPEPSPTPSPAPAPGPPPAPAATPTPTPTPVSAPRDRSAPTLLVSRRTIRVDRLGRFRVVLVTSEPASGDVVADTATSPRRRLGRAVFAIRAGIRAPVRIRLTAAGRRVLRRARGRAVAMRVKVDARDRAGNSVQVSARLRVKLRR